MMIFRFTALCFHLLSNCVDFQSYLMVSNLRRFFGGPATGLAQKSLNDGTFRLVRTRPSPQKLGHLLLDERFKSLTDLIEDGTAEGHELDASPMDHFQPSDQLVQAARGVLFQPSLMFAANLRLQPRVVELLSTALQAIDLQTR